MRIAIRGLIATVLLAAWLPSAQAYQDTGDRYIQQDESQLVEHGSYTNVDGRQVHSPAHTKNGQAPAGASAKCRDGSYSFSQHRRGTCSHHGGVGEWL